MTRRPQLFPSATAAYLAFTILVEPEDLLRCGWLRLATPQMPSVVVRVLARRGQVLDVLVAEGDPVADPREPLAQFVFDPLGKQVTPTRLWLAGQRLDAPQSQAMAPEARRQREAAQDLLLSYLMFLVVWCYHLEGLTLREAWRDALEEGAGGGG